MKVKLKSLLLCGSFIGIFLLLATQAFADSEDTPIINAADYQDEEKLQEEVSQLLSDPTVTGVTVVNKSQMNNSFGTRLAIGSFRSYGEYLVQRLPNAGYTYGSTIHAAASDPDITMNLDYSTNLAASITNESDLSAMYLSLAAGFSVTGSYPVSYSGSIQAPETNDGKTVDKLTMKAYPVYEKIRMNIWKNGKYQGITIVKKPVGIYYKKGFTYENPAQ
ncbi:hypothetical protein SAMN05421736_101140 [Evansella caseinilytica]|uniref:Uncharacterized protein n=1 Tax=Evansella caseinilytica TaxID=1503961 RepID=A0A1H3GFV6_9BACI|nr:hypothetical protein [Evansella caseinilytica]SDY01374.1 hypothetical protein SAMN05421736_101140 [Evansella caseinilytica]